MNKQISFLERARRSAIEERVDSLIERVDKPHRNEAVLRKCYYSLGLTVRETADKLGVTKRTIQNHMERHGLDRRSRGQAVSEARRQHGVPANTTPGGYLQFNVYTEGKTVTFYGHQIEALHENSVGEVFADNTDVHHHYRIPLGGYSDERDAQLDIPENLEVLDRTEHRQKHGRDEFRPPAIEDVVDFEGSEEGQ